MSAERDPVWALGPGETYPPAPPLWECVEPTCTCREIHAFGGDGPRTSGWRKVWPPVPQVVVPAPQG